MSGFLSGRDEMNRERILEGTIKVFRDKGSTFTMNDLSKELGMSKKTIYVAFRDKESLLYNLVDYFFDSVKKCEREIVCDDSLSIKEKITNMLGVLPVKYKDVDLTGVAFLKDKYPRVAEHIAERLESGWESTFTVLDEGIKEGIFRDVNHTVFKLTFESAIERFISTDELYRAHIKYSDALEELVNTMIGGILA